MSAVLFGDRAVRVPRPASVGASAARALVEALLARDGVTDVVLTEEHVAVYLASPADPADVAAWVERAADDARTSARAARAGRLHEIEVIYDGEDLAAIARASALSEEEVARAHAERVYEVVMIGFLPGFAYLGEVDARIVAPRRASPRARVPAGSVAIGGAYTAVYPFGSPGGWNLVGRAPAFEGVAAAAPAPSLTWDLGDRVRFRAATGRAR